MPVLHIIIIFGHSVGAFASEKLRNRKAAFIGP